MRGWGRVKGKRLQKMSEHDVFELLRMVAVLALVCVAAALATPKGRLPLALRGMAKLFRVQGEERAVPVWKRLLAFLLVVLAVVLALI